MFILSLVNPHLFRAVKQNLRNLQGNGALYISIYIWLGLILNFMCSTAKNVTSHSSLMNPPGTALDISKFTTHCVNTV